MHEQEINYEKWSRNKRLRVCCSDFECLCYWMRVGVNKKHFHNPWLYFGCQFYGGRWSSRWEPCTDLLSAWKQFMFKVIFSLLICFSPLFWFIFFNFFCCFILLSWVGPGNLRTVQLVNKSLSVLYIIRMHPWSTVVIYKKSDKNLKKIHKNLTKQTKRRKIDWS